MKNTWNKKDFIMPDTFLDPKQWTCSQFVLSCVVFSGYGT